MAVRDDINDSNVIEKLQEFSNQNKPYVLFFCAKWCEACNEISGNVEKIANDFDNTLEFIKINVDHNPKITNDNKITAVPSLLFCKNGEEIDRIIGAHEEKNIKFMIKQSLEITY